MPALFDVNVLLALATDRHASHVAAARWIDGVTVGEAVICGVAQTGLLRLLNTPAVMRDALPAGHSAPVAGRRTDPFFPCRATRP